MLLLRLSLSLSLSPFLLCSSFLPKLGKILRDGQNAITSVCEVSCEHSHPFPFHHWLSVFHFFCLLYCVFSLFPTPLPPLLPLFLSLSVFQCCDRAHKLTCHYFGSLNQAYYVQKGNRVPLWPESIAATFEASVDSAADKLQSYLKQAEDYHNSCLLGALIYVSVCKCVCEYMCMFVFDVHSKCPFNGDPLHSCCQLNKINKITDYCATIPIHQGVEFLPVFFRVSYIVARRVTVCMPAVTVDCQQWRHRSAWQPLWMHRGTPTSALGWMSALWRGQGQSSLIFNLW